MARLNVKLPTDDDLMKNAVDGRDPSGKTISGNKLEKLRQTCGQSEHRILLLWLKAAFNAIEAGIMTAEALFLPFLEGKDGRTVAEVAIPQMANLLSGGAGRLLHE